MNFLKCHTHKQLHQFSHFTTESHPHFIDREVLKDDDDDSNNLLKRH